MALVPALFPGYEVRVCYQMVCSVAQRRYYSSKRSSLSARLSKDAGITLPEEYITDGPGTFSMEERLPPPPQCKLDTTLRKYLASVHPLVNDREYKRTQDIVARFASGIGQQLQDKLIHRTNLQPNWLIDEWVQKCYQENRSPLCPLVNTGGTAAISSSSRAVWEQEDTPGGGRGHLHVASMSLYALGQLWNILRKEYLRIDQLGRRLGKHVCMDQYRRLFNFGRVPGVKHDHFVSYFKTEAEGICPDHVIVICKGYLFVVHLLHTGGQHFLTPLELETQLTDIWERCTHLPPAPGIGALTALDRSSWAQVQAYLCSSHPRHRPNLEKIESAVSVLVLERDSPKDHQQLMAAAQSGNPEMRWFDKSVTQIVFRNGKMAFNFEHGAVDGMVSGQSMDFINKCLHLSSGKWVGDIDSRPLKSPEQLIFLEDSRISEQIKQSSRTLQEVGALKAQMSSNIILVPAANRFVAKTNSTPSKEIYLGKADTQVGRLEWVYPQYVYCGKEFIREYGYHPDAYVQMAIQLAYYKLHHRMDLLEAAMDKYVSDLHDCNHMQGCSLHLMGLKQIAEEENIPMPDFFQDPSYFLSGGEDNFLLSTASNGYTNIHASAGPLIEAGYGCYYTIHPHTISFSISAWRHQNCVHTFYKALREAFGEMERLVVGTRTSRPRM